MNALLDVTIGLVFLYLLLGLVCTILTELASSVLGLRAKTFSKGLDEILGGQSSALKAAFDATGIMKTARRMSGKHGPSYLAPENFTAAIVETAKSTGAFAGRIDKVADLIECLDALPDSDLKKSLIAVVDSADDKVEDAKKRIGTWFDSMMDRASGNFNRDVKRRTAVYAVLITIAFNADSLTVANALWTDAALRDQIADSAASFVAEAEDVDDLADLEVVQSELRPFPIGWDTSGAPPHVCDWYASWQGVVLKVIGWLITALAVSLGAPFWFDLLKKLVALRGSGPAPKPEPTQPRVA